MKVTIEFVDNTKKVYEVENYKELLKKLHDDGKKDTDLKNIEYES